MAMIQTFPSGGSSKGGHTILDTDGTSLAQEEKLQFNGLSVTDDPTNGITKVEGEGLNSDSIDDITSANTINPAVIIGDSNNYSTTEKIVGKWIDGKPLYQKTVNCGTSFGIINHNIANIDNVIDAAGIGLDGVGGGYNIPFAGSNWIQCYATRVKIDLQPASSGWNLSGGIYITLKYTKTTD